MEESKKKKQKIIYIIFALLAIVAIVFVVLGSSGKINDMILKHQAEKNREELIASASNVEDEMTLRQLLLLDEELEITVNEDVEIKTGFTVNGTKTLHGNAVISSNLGILRPISILNVTPNAKLIMDGLVIDGNGNAVGIQVQNKAELVYLSGKIAYAGTYGILTNGLVTIEDVTISDCITAAIDAGFQSKVYFKGGQLVDNRHIAVYVEAKSYMEISGDAVIDGTAGQGIRNRGELLIKGGEFKNVGKFVVVNHDKLTIAYEGRGDGYVQVSNAGSGVVYNDTTGTSDVKDVYATNSGTDAYKCVGGKMSVENCVVDKVGTHGFYLSYGEIAIKDVKVDTTGACGIYTMSPAVVTVENLELNNLGSRGIMSLGADVTGKNITINTTSTVGVSNQASKEGKTSTNEYTNLTVKGAGTNSINNSGGAKTILTNSVLEESGRTNVFAGKGELTLNNVEIKGTAADNYAAISINEAGTCTMSGNSKIHGKGIRGVNISGIFNMQGGEIYGYKVEKQSGGAVRLFKGGVFNMSGGSIHDNTTNYGGGAVYLNAHTTANMTGGKIYNNTARTTGGAVQVEINSVFNMKGGSIENNKTLEASGGAMYILGKAYMSDGTIAGNKSATVGGAVNLYNKTDADTGKKVYGEFHMSGGTMKQNSSTGNGGAIHISSGTNVTMSGGRITDNTSVGSGSGINQNGTFTMSGSAYVGNNVITLGSTSKVVTVTGTSLSAHSAQNPLLIEPSFGAEIGTVVAKYESAAISAGMLRSVAPGSKAYASFAQSAENTVIGSYNEKVDMSMAGADTVYVSDFQRLKEAVESTTSKRNVVISANIKMEGVVTVPAGTTVSIKDDGTQRTLTRAEGNTSSFFRTTFGTGLYIAGSQKGNLVLDGKASAGTDPTTVQQLVIVRGATEISNVTFKDNNAEKVTGAFVRHLYGTLNVANSTFNGGYANAGGAIASSKGTLSVTNSTFAGNGTKSGGGAIRVENGASAIVKSSGFSGNTAGTVGGAINCDNGTLTVEATTFTGNTSKGTSGAVNLTNTSTATIIGSTFDGNQSTADNAGAIKVNKSTLVLNGTTFTNNKTTESGGAIFVEGKISDDTYANVTATGCTFEGNVAEKTGGAIKGETGIVITLTDSDFIQNSSKGTTGGAIDLYKSTVTATGCTFEKNSANTYGGAIYLNKEAAADLTECGFDGNRVESRGAAIYLVSDATATVTGGSFQNNVAANEGGAIYTNGGTLKSISGVTFSNNTSTGSGGAVYVNTGAEANFDNSSFAENKTENEAGGAIYTKGAITADTCTFTSNSAKTRGGAVWINGDAASANISGSTFKTNTSGNTGGALEVNGASAETAVVENCTFDGNSATNNGDAIYVRSGKAITISGGTFVNEGNTVAFESSTNMGQAIVSGVITGAIFIYSQPNKAGIVIDEAGIAGSDITIIPKAYIAGHVVIAKAEKAADAVLEEAAEFIKIEDNNDGLEWGMNPDGTLYTEEPQVSVAQNKETGATYTDIQTAIDAAGAGETIYVLQDMELLQTITVSGGKNVILTNMTGQNIMLIRAFEGSLFNVESGSTLTLGSADKTNTFVIDGGTVTGPTLVNNAGVFNLLENTTLQNARTKGNSSNASNDGGALYNTGTANLAGNFIGNRGYNGGAVYNAKGTLNITGGIYSGNTGGGQGGAVYVASATDSAVIANAEMTKNVVSQTHDRGVAIYLQGGTTANEMTLENCNIHGNVVTGTSDTDPGSDIMLADSTTLNLKNNMNVGVIHQRYGGTNPYAVINILENYTGAIVIIPNANNCKAGETQLVNFASQMSDEERVATAGIVVVRTVTGGVKDDTTYCIDVNGVLQSVAAKIGDTSYGTLEEAVAAAQSGDIVYVLKDIELSEAIAIGDGKNITITNATGKDIKLTRTGSASMFTVEGGSALTLGSTDTANKLVLDGGYVADAKDPLTGASAINNAGTFTLQANTTIQNASAGTENGGAVTNTGTAVLSGTFTGNLGKNGGAVYNAGGTVTVTGGTYANNISTSGGGAIYSGTTGNKVTIEGGSFYGNETKGGTSGVIYCNGTLTITGGEYYENKAVTGGGVVNVAGTASISNAVMYDNTLTGSSYAGGAIYISGSKKLTLENCNIYNNNSDYKDNTNPGCDISMGANAVLNLNNNINVGVVHLKNANGTINVQAAYTGQMVLIPNNNDYTIGTQLVTFAAGTEESAKNMTVRKYTSKTEYNDDTYCVGTDGTLQYASNAVKVGDKTYLTLSEAIAAVETSEETTIYVLRDTDIREAVQIGDDTKVRNITITNAEGMVVALQRGSELTTEMFNVASGSTLNITGAVTVDGKGVATATYSLVENSGTFILGEDACLTGGNAGTGNNAENNGGALFNAIGAEAILSGNVSGNTAYKGGAIYNCGVITIKGGTYEDNKSANNAAVLYNAGGTLTIEAGEFKNNTANQAGAVIYSNDLNGVGTLKISGGTFDSNTATAGTGGVIYCSSSVFEITGGTFKNNKAVTGGGVVNIAMSGAKISGVTMTGNTLTATSGNTFYGGAIYIGSGKTLELSNSNIYNNTSNYDTKIPSCDISNNGTLTIKDIVADDGNDKTTEQCLVYQYKTKAVYYVDADGKTLVEKR